MFYFYFYFWSIANFQYNKNKQLKKEVLDLAKDPQVSDEDKEQLKVLEKALNSSMKSGIWLTIAYAALLVIWVLNLVKVLA